MNGYLNSIETLTAGDFVGELSSPYTDVRKLEVARVTKTRAFMTDGSVWNKHAKRANASAFMSTVYKLVTVEKMNELNAARAALAAHGALVFEAEAALKDARFFSDDQLARILAITKEPRS